MSQPAGLLLLLLGARFGSFIHAPVLTKQQTLFVPRAVTFLYHYNPPRDDGTVAVWPLLGENPETRKMMAKDKMDPKTLVTDSNPNWADVLLTDWEYGEDRDGKLFRRHQLENPVFIRTEHPGNEICSQPGATKVVSILMDSGLPFEVPCYSCSSSSERPTTFNLLPFRDFYNQPFHDRMERFRSDKDAPDLTYHVPVVSVLFQSVHNLLNEISSDPVIVQSVTRDFGGQVWRDRDNYVEGTGRLQIAPSENFLRLFNMSLYPAAANLEKVKRTLRSIQDLQAVKYGATYQCVRDKESTDVVVNVDNLVLLEDSPYPTTSNLELYEEWTARWDFSSLVFPQDNLKQKFNYSQQVYSFRTRKGYLTLLKINSKLPANLGESFARNAFPIDQDHLENIFDAIPYSETGIPLFSSLIPRDLRQAVHEKYTTKAVKMLNATAQLIDYKGAGLFVQKRSCHNDPEKMDCALLAKCRGLEKYTEMKKELEEGQVDEVDPCADSPFTPIILSATFTTVEIEADHNYRIMVDDAIFVTGKGVSWQVQRKTVNAYDRRKDCDEQGWVVHPNNMHLLLTNLKKQLLKLSILARLSNGQKIYLRTTDAHEGEVDEGSVTTIFIWGCVILAFVLFLVAFAWYMHRLRLKRISERLKARTENRKEDNGSAQKTQSSSAETK